MQRWIILGIVALVLVGGGAGFGLWTYRQNRPAPMWVPLVINREIAEDKQEEAAAEIKQKLSQPAILNQVCGDLRLAKKWDLATDEAAASELLKRLFVRVGEADSPMGRVPSLNVGVNGARKEVALSGEIAVRLMEEVRKILGLDLPPETSK